MIASRSQAGFTAIELLVSFAVAAIVLAGATLAFQTSQTATLTFTDQASAQQKARWGLERMIQEIRGAGVDPCTPPRCPSVPPHFDAITNQSPIMLTIQSDFNGNGIIDPPGGACDPAAVTERVRYQLNGNQLQRSTDPNNAACDATVASGVTALSFTYLDEAGNPTAVASAIRTVVISVTIASENGGSEKSVAMADRVRIRNR
ncbi:MAG TPA: prepilin-type N-terminal cleavage/methylation domain-containing protein [Candidatus Acidoferrum sp.]|nr:prepilin-type N-terminal cleavage/methylation domain-containing protein [Candidatus Acidoferrum sp.]